MSAQGDGGRWSGGEPCRSPKVSPSSAGLGGLGHPLGSQLVLGAGWILELSPTCSHLAGLLLHCGVELLSCSSLGCCVGASHHPGKFPPFHARPMCCAASSWLFFPCVVKQKQKPSAKMFFAHRAHPVCANSSFNTPSFYCKSVAAGEHEGSQCGRGWQVPDPWQQCPRTP